MSGKNVVVTGGGSGIGLACAVSLRKQGHRVAITGRRLNVLQSVADANDFYPIQMDVRDDQNVAAGMQQIADEFGSIDIVIANAGIAKGQGIRGATTELWRDIMATNLDGAFFTIREAMKHMPLETWGRVIAISSIAGVRGLKGAHAYSASKHGVIGLIRTLAADFATQPVTFNAVCPGYVDTGIIDQNVENLTARLNIDADQARDMMVNLNPHGRLITPEEVATTVQWLCGEGSASVDGQAIEISGGLPPR